MRLYDADPAAATAPATLLDYRHQLQQPDIDRCASDRRLCHCANKPRVQRVVTFMSQPDYPVAVPPPALSNGSYHIYLDVWERLITYVEDDSIREVALKAPTPRRAPRSCGRSGASAGANAARTCVTPQGLYDLLQPFELARLRARAKPPHTSDDPHHCARCALSRAGEPMLPRRNPHRQRRSRWQRRHPDLQVVAREWQRRVPDRQRRRTDVWCWRTSAGTIASA